MEDNHVSYTKATSAWPRGDVLQVVSAVDTVIASFPIQFVRQSGDNTWRYIAFVISLLVIEEPDHPRVIVDAASNPVALDAQPGPGVFRYIETSAAAFTEVRFAPGPEYFSSQIAPAGIIGSSTAGSSDRSRSSSDQSAFRELLVARDGTCPVTGHRPPQCDAAHLVPASRPDLYAQLVGSEDDTYREDAGILLDKTMHKLYDSLMWSFYRKDSTYYVHVFNPQSGMRDLHGKIIPADYFRPAFDPPNQQLIAWHYAQCVKMRIRGFSVGMRSRTRGRR